MAKCRYPLESAEQELGTWTVNLIISDAGRYLGDLTITNQNLIFLGKFDLSLNAIVDKALFRTIDREQYLVIPRSTIESFSARKSILNKRVTVITGDNSEFVIDYGMMSIDPILKALEAG